MLKKTIAAIAGIAMIIGCSGTTTLCAEESTTVTEYTYYFYEDTVNSSGSMNYGEVEELVITSVPQFFYIDTIEADAVSSIEIRSGYETGSAQTSFYLYDCGNAAVSETELTEFCTDTSGLIKIGSVCDEKTATWGYRTAVVDANGAEFTENSGYTLLDTSEALDITDVSGDMALIVGIDGDIGSKAYFEYIKINYSREVSAPMPIIEGICGDGIKDYTVEINKSDRSVVIPVIPGTDISTLDPEIITSGEASLTDGTWADGTITVTYGDREVEWSVCCEERGNPVLNGYYADPNIVCFDDTFYIYPTTDCGTSWDSTSFKVFSSKDMINWTEEGVILDLADVSWSGGVNAWAPTIAEKNGKFYFYFSAKNKDDDVKSLGVAVSDSPTGPFEAMDTPLIEGGELSGQMIDPAVFIDDDGTAYLYWGNGSMYMAKLSDDMLSIDGEIYNITPSNFREGAFVIKRGGTYYFMWSCNDTGEPTYQVHYGTSDSPYGPIEGNTTILSYYNTDDSRIKATGHNSVVNVPGTDEWYICYHRFNIPGYGNVTSKNSEAGNHREVCIDRLTFNEAGEIETVTPTLAGITEPVTAKAASIVACEVSDNVLNIEFAVSDSANADIYTAVYASDGHLAGVIINKSEAQISVEPDEVYTVKLMIWYNGDMTPVSVAEERVVSS